ncbi:MAG: hypothetical protein L0Y76_07540, partial [Ignavibacteria bacterium]|nr:hypothetical protein [Ignavibacteria bacterium]
AEAPEGMLRKEFGVNGIVFRRLARGEDTSGIFHRERPERCLNHHHTLTNNIHEPGKVRNEIRRVGEYLCRKMRAKKLVAGYLYLVIRYGNLRYATADMRLPQHTNDDREIFDAAMKLYKLIPEPTKDMPARMFGMTVFGLHADSGDYNLDLFTNRVHMPFYELDKIKQRFGEGIIRVGLNGG